MSEKPYTWIDVFNKLTSGEENAEEQAGRMIEERNKWKEENSLPNKLKNTLTGGFDDLKKYALIAGAAGLGLFLLSRR